MAKKMTKKNAADVLFRISGLIQSNKGGLAKPLLYAINEALDGMLDGDAFGTEGQLDPRGDRRDEEDES